MKKGISLVALIVTIIVLIIISGVAIMSVGENGIINKAIYANEQAKKDYARDKIIIKLGELKTNVAVNENRETLANDLFSFVDSDSIYYDKDILSVANRENGLIDISMDGYVFTVDSDYKVLLIDNIALSNSEEQVDSIQYEYILDNIISDTQYIINNEILTFEKIIAVGPSETYQTVKQGLDYLCDNGYKENGAIILTAGTYDTANVHTGTSYNYNAKYNGMTVSIIGDKPGEVFMTAGEMSMAQNNSSYSMKLKFYRIVFVPPVYSDIGSDGFTLDDDSIPNEYYNCVFVPAVGGWNGTISSASVYAYNCLFLGGANSYATSNPISGLAQNCASINDFIGPENGTKTTCLTNAVVDSTYNITTTGWQNVGTGLNPDGSQAHIGVYGGIYAWDNIILTKDYDNKTVSLNIKDFFYEYTVVKYMFGEVDPEKIIKNGRTINIEDGQAIINMTTNGVYTFVVIKESKYIAVVSTKVEGLSESSTYQINNEIFTFNRIARVGINEEFTTYKSALDYLCDNGYKEDGAIILTAGTYDTANIHTGTSYNYNAKYNGMNVSIIAETPGEVFMTAGEMSMAQNNSSYSMKLKFYRIVFVPPVYSDVGSNGFNLDNDSVSNEYYNCVFVPAVGGWNGTISSASVYAYNCLFLGGANSYATSNPISGLAQNCASINDFIGPENGTKTTCLTNAVVDSTYNITTTGWQNVGTGLNPDGSQAHIGVYGGIYAWNNIRFEVDSVNKKINIDISDIYGTVNGLKYIYGGGKTEEEILSNGITVNVINNHATIDITDNGIYKFLVSGVAEYNIIKTLKVEGQDVTSTYQINNETLTFDRIARVGIGEEFTTYKSALDYLCDNGYKEDGAIILTAGTYDTANIHTGTSYTYNAKYNGMNVSIIAETPGEVFMTAGEMGVAENNSSYSMKLKFYRIVFVPPVYSDVGSNGFHLDSDSVSNEYYNCVFVPAVGGWNGTISSASVYAYNCLFLGGANSYATSNPISGLAQNCASINDFIGPENGTKTTCLINVTTDSEYNITSAGWQNTGTGLNPDSSQSHIGLYGGIYSW
ncbi:MAG: hypothetical protein PHH22_00935 [Clostridia bacterium]|nr:hypothetical protein [Clostridia bacterium]